MKNSEYVVIVESASANNYNVFGLFTRKKAKEFAVREAKEFLKEFHNTCRLKIKRDYVAIMAGKECSKQFPELSNEPLIIWTITLLQKGNK